ncbi:MerR family transcriptional regulator [Actinopolymorpha alba]|uniref:MerR family transcriptional regulator n=1 Tax=Actinopolymorpha alba TaxID=533267 RepID=UPI0003617B1B|nr:MerR family transcriptional regulator [Actinopolymorpha alba]
MLIGELSARTDVPSRLLRYYEEQGLLDAKRDSNGYRRYADDAVVRVRQIRALLHAGLSTNVIRDVLPCANGDRPALDLCPRLAGILRRELADLDGRIDTLRQTRGTLAGFLDAP